MKIRVQHYLKCLLVAGLGGILAISLSACETKQQTGSLLGAGTGALLGSQFGGGTGRLVATGIGAVAGAFIGGSIGQSMDKTDRLEAQRAIETTPTGQEKTWVNPDNNNTYTVTPEKTYYRNKRPCREYTMDVRMADGEIHRIYGNACRQRDGSWQAVN